MKQFIVTLFILITITKGFSQGIQSDSTKNRKQLPIGVFPVLGYAWQGYNNIELGIRVVRLLKHPHDNISVTISYNIFKYNVTYASPFIGVRYYNQLQKRIGSFISLNYSTTRVNGISDKKITPEIGLGTPVISISYGYNIDVGVENINFISHHKFTIRLSAF